MKVTYDPQSKVTGEITVTLDSNDYAADVKKRMKEVQNTASEKGFRPGKVPAALIQKKYGHAVKYDVLTKAVSDELYKFIEKEGLHVLGNPEMEADENMDLDKDELTFKFKVALAPEFNVEVNKDMHVPAYDVQVTDQMVQTSIDNLRKQFGEQVPGDEVDDNSLVKGVLTELNEDQSGPKENGIVQEMGIVAPKYFTSADQRALFEGRKVGDEVIFTPWDTCDGNEVELSSMLGVPREEVADHKGPFEMNIREIIVVKPAELNQDFFDRVLGKDVAHNEEEFREAVRTRIKKEIAGQEFYIFSRDAKKVILEAAGNVEMPDEMIKNMLAKENKWPADEVDSIYEQVRPDVVWELLSDYLAKQFKLELNQDDVKNAMRGRAAQALAQYGMTNLPDDVLNQYADRMMADKNAVQRTAQQALEMKLFNAIHAAVTVDEKKVSEEEFAALFHQGQVDATEEQDS